MRSNQHHWRVVPWIWVRQRSISDISHFMNSCCKKKCICIFYCCLNSLLSTPFVYLYSHLVDSLNSIVYGIFSVSVLYFTLTTSVIKRRIVLTYDTKRRLLKKGLSKVKHSLFLLMEVTFYKIDVGFSCHNSTEV